MGSTTRTRKWPVHGWIGLGLIAVLLVWEHSLVRPEDLSRVNAAFFTANALIGGILLVAVGADVFV